MGNMDGSTDTAPGMGHNGGPPLTPLERVTDRVSDLYAEAKQWLDGEEITNQALADGVSKLLNLIREAEKEADDARKTEKAPYLEGQRAVDAAYKPVLAKAKLAESACKAALTPWLIKLDAEQRRLAEEERRRADEAAAAALEAVRGADRTNLTAIEEAEEALKAAKKLDRAAGRAERGKAAAGGEVGRVVTLRTSFIPVMVDPGEALKHYRMTQPGALKDFLLELAKGEVRAGKRSIPGFEIEERKEAV